ncbi:MAG TPA: site-2 protease family protein [Candidatus Limnocylindrales bacterium]|nr:site-2 protease family protein [Candidatus Limnocylindrales bacterium]
MDPELGRELFSAFIVVAVMLLVGFPVHEFMHAWTAYRLGDNTARWAGRVTLDPRVHFDQMGGLFLALTAGLGALSGGGLLFGWARPTPVNPMNLRHGRQGHALVAFAGPASNLVIAAVVAIPLRLIEGDLDRLLFVRQTPLLELAYNVLLLLLGLNIVLFLFNLLPIPPLDGWSVVRGIVPASVAYRMREVEIQYANIIPVLFLGFVVILFVSGGSLLGPIVNGIADLLLGR